MGHSRSFLACAVWVSCGSREEVVKKSRWCPPYLRGLLGAGAALFVASLARESLQLALDRPQRIVSYTWIVHWSTPKTILNRQNETNN